MINKRKLVNTIHWGCRVFALMVMGVTVSLTASCKDEQLNTPQVTESSGSGKNVKSPGPVQKSAMTVYSIRSPDKRNTVLSSSQVQSVFEALHKRQLIRVKMMPNFEYRLDILYSGKAENWEISDSGFARQLNVNDTNIYRIENFDVLWEKLKPQK
ncbi:hypothetical protein [Pleionea litopenaei]|uniref:Uncharacterized protein n=1 Tax=Pleionea litopenaei TaxID=3070815 RepID=A0AA51RVA8_9GAMM|nr:hypothetical protein [Pleionea sp. HL-JVS1]WMS88230.1 hypothetical protein Q9312_04765 [Pleionea sp. HL-JVS1]